MRILAFTFSILFINFNAYASNCAVQFSFSSSGEIEIKTENPDIPDHFKKMNLLDDDGNMSYLIIFKDLQNADADFLKKGNSVNLTQEQSNILRAAAQRSLAYMQTLKNHREFIDLVAQKEKMANEILEALNANPRAINKDIFAQMAQDLESEREAWYYQVTPQDSSIARFGYSVCSEPLTPRCPLSHSCAANKDFDYHNYISTALCSDNFQTGAREFEENSHAACKDYKIALGSEVPTSSAQPEALTGSGRPR